MIIQHIKNKQTCKNSQTHQLQPNNIYWLTWRKPQLHNYSQTEALHNHISIKLKILLLRSFRKRPSQTQNYWVQISRVLGGKVKMLNL